ncbi:IRX15/IRX15L/IGXM [Arabidopsis thaliana x Arabidopsis arenosa]|uniref:IRX15/IRX15L/IGXM n=1 Tax=Arabidopsis thaliana x Arabidopsis arenosa TaxID=1240361 RepID=A0A8T2AY46_9BRAS|nr:IRX15/IRX15L/IGXM [Arabidopsis thaliana x Arabidopsis arenosa]
MKSNNTNTNLILFHHHSPLTSKSSSAVAAANHHRLLFIFFLSFFTLLFSFSLFSSSSIHSTTTSNSLSSSPSSLPPPVLAALLHYTSSSPPNTSMSFLELSTISSIIHSHGPTCNLLIFGLTHESLLWRSINFQGRTVFVDESPYSVSKFEQSNPGVEAYEVVYSTKVSQAWKLLGYYKTRPECRPVQNLLFSDCKLGINDLPNFVYEIDWDVILIDGPRGYASDSPGRMAPIFTSAVLAKSKDFGTKTKTDVFVHEFGRKIERVYSDEFLCEENLVEVVGDLGHFVVAAAEERESFGNGFCRNSTRLSESFTAVSGGDEDKVGVDDE